MQVNGPEGRKQRSKCHCIKGFTVNGYMPICPRTYVSPYRCIPVPNPNLTPTGTRTHRYGDTYTQVRGHIGKGTHRYVDTSVFSVGRTSIRGHVGLTTSRFTKLAVSIVVRHGMVVPVCTCNTYSPVILHITAIQQ